MANTESATARYKLTYATMFDPPPEIHGAFDAALTKVRSRFGREHAMLIGGQDIHTEAKLEERSPINREWLLGIFQNGMSEQLEHAVASARAASPVWAAKPWPERVRLLRRAAQLLEERLFEIGAVLALEVGKDRMEALGEAQEAADLIGFYCSQMESNRGFEVWLPNDPIKGYVSRNRSVLKPYGVWAVIAPFNYPLALIAGPAAAALVAGNTVVFKSSSDTPWSGRLLAEILRESGLPDGTFNYVTCSGDVAEDTLVRHPEVSGITFTGSYEVGMHIYRTFADEGQFPRPCIVEMGGKNAAIVSRHADIDRAALGIVRSAFGLQGQKSSACSRVYVEREVAGALRHTLRELTTAIRIGDPSMRHNWVGPVINARSYAKFSDYMANLHKSAQVFVGGAQLSDNGLDAGFFCKPTLAVAPLDHPLWHEEMFLPVALVGEVDSLDEAMRHANAVDYGLTAGFYGNAEEQEWFLRHIEAGVVYVNRPQGATTGAWPGLQPFGRWKASGSTGKSAGSFYYLPQYMREQSQTIVD